MNLNASSNNKGCAIATDGFAAPISLRGVNDIAGAFAKGLEPATKGGTRRVASDQPAGLMGCELLDFRLAYALTRAESTPLASEPMLFPSTR
jgi:hypothetical protein